MLKVIAWRITKKNSLLLICGAIVTSLLAHVCCWGPILLIPLGLGGVSYFLGHIADTYKPYVNLLPIAMIILAGWRIHSKPDSCFMEKVIYWITVLLVSAIMLL